MSSARRRGRWFDRCACHVGGMLNIRHGGRPMHGHVERDHCPERGGARVAGKRGALRLSVKLVVMVFGHVGTVGHGSRRERRCRCGAQGGRAEHQGECKQEQSEQFHRAEPPQRNGQRQPLARAAGDHMNAVSIALQNQNLIPATKLTAFASSPAERAYCAVSPVLPDHSTPM